MNNFNKTQNICRICLIENNKKNQSVFDTIGFTKEPMKFSELIMACANVEIMPGDKLPDQLCSTCVQNTIKLYLFKIKCEESDQTLRTHLEEDPFTVTEKIEIGEEHILEKLKSEIIDENDVSNDGISDEGSVGDIEIKNELRETLVNEDYDYDTNCEAKYVEPFITVKNETTTDRLLSNEKESFEFDNVKSEEKNILNQLNRNKVAEMAKKIKMIMKTNFKSTGNDEIKSQSIRYFSTKSRMLRKPRLNSERTSYKCIFCRKIFMRKISLLRHENLVHKNMVHENKNISTSEKPYKCDVCGMNFKRSTGLLVHKRIHTGETPFKCDVCEKKYLYPTSLIVHQRTHTNEGSYECDVCKKKILNVGAIFAHKRMHSDEKT